MARSAKPSTAGAAGAYSPAPDTAAEEAAEATPAGPDQATAHPVVHRPHSANAPFQP